MNVSQIFPARPAGQVRLNRVQNNVRIHPRPTAGPGPTLAPPTTGPPPTQGSLTRELSPRNNNRRANITIGTLNLNGYSAPSSAMNGIDKWSSIIRHMNKFKIAILAVQETHLDDSRVNDILSLFGHKITLVTSQDPNAPRATAGVAFILNRKFIRPQSTVVYELHPGRALYMRIKWHESGDEDTTLLNIYAPNNKSDHKSFWERIDARRHLHRLRRPDFMLGDFNVTEDNIDRAPAHPDDPGAVSALRETRHKWDLIDAWCHAYPNTKSFTYRANSNAQQIHSRLDRIYTACETAQYTSDWKSGPTSTPTDHWIVSVKYSPRDAPLIGSGRWTWPIASTQNNELMTKITARGTRLQADMTKLQHETVDREVSNPQILWRDFKLDISAIAKQATKESRHKVDSKINTLRKNINDLNEQPDFDTNNHLRESEARLARELAHLEKVNTRTQKDILHAKIAAHGERLGGIWSAISKENKPRNPIKRLKVPGSNPAQYERNTVRMAQLARDYHDNLQQDGLTTPVNDEAHEQALNEVLNTIPGDQLLQEPTYTPLNWCATHAQVEEALKLSKNGSATGMDGCPYELWKALHSRYTAARQMNQDGFDVIKALTDVFNDIQTHGVDPGTNFALGWMCPLYKKKDPNDISNYRPITLMNSDYKLLTKTLALQLMQPIHTLVHEDQASFIPRRSIFNHIRLARSIISYAEVMEEDGVIIALDQEKAYDKIRHDYLWRTLESFNIPQTFIKTVQALYRNAQTQVAVNGVFSSPFNVTRGVRQGDPLSCPLFDLAIEPLACMLRGDDRISGIATPNTDRNVLVTMFADDTTLYLNKHDRFDDVQETLNRWCSVSGAKFNIEKTEIIPIGTEEHRSTVVATRKINHRDLSPLSDHIHIAKDGEATRSLGAWIGNNIDDITPWEIVLDNIRNGLKRWRPVRPTLHGRSTVIKSIVGGHTQFLTKAQGMPPEIEKAITQIIRDYLREDGSSPRIALEILCQPIERGGINLLDIKARNEAIELTWLKAYLDLSPSRPTWAKITDLTINAAAPPGISTLARFNSFLQSWNPPTRGPRLSLLNNDMVRMLGAARKHNTHFAPIRMTPHLRAQLPAWYHLNAEASPLTTTTARCLLRKHAITTVADLISTSARLRTTNQHLPHVPNPLCPCTDCSQDRVNGCRNPHACAKDAMSRIHLIAPKFNPLEIGDHHDNLSLTPSRKERNRDARRTEGCVRFDPSITCRDNLSDGFRIFTTPENISSIPARRYHTQGINHRH